MWFSRDSALAHGGTSAVADQVTAEVLTVVDNAQQQHRPPRGTRPMKTEVQARTLTRRSASTKPNAAIVRIIGLSLDDHLPENRSPSGSLSMPRETRNRVRLAPARDARACPPGHDHRCPQGCLRPRPRAEPGDAEERPHDRGKPCTRGQ